MSVLERDISRWDAWDDGRDKDKRAGRLLGYTSAKGVTSLVVLVQIDEGRQYVSRETLPNITN